MRNIMQFGRKRTAIAVPVIGVIAVLLWQFAGRPAAVEVIHPERRNVTEFVIASGRLRAVRASEIGPDVGGIVETVTAEEGDLVEAGEVLIALQQEDAEHRVERAVRALETARRELARVHSGPQAEEIERARAQLRRAEAVGAAGLQAARERLGDLERGGRPEQRRRAEAALAEARAAREQADLDYRRARTLAAEGALSDAEADLAGTARTRALAAQRRAEQELALAIEPASAEQIAAARADVAVAEAEYLGSVAVARETLNALLGQPRPEDVSVAEARVREAESSLDVARRDLAKRTIRSPVSGLVTVRSVEPGQSVLPGQRLLTVADMRATEIYVETDESNLGRLSVGQEALLISPAYSDRPFTGHLVQIGPEVDYDRGVVGLRVVADDLPDFARPDMTVDVNIEVAHFEDALSIPASALLETGVHAYVLRVENSAAVRQEVRVLGRSSEYVAIAGLSERTAVVLNATAVADGQSLRPREPH